MFFALLLAVGLGRARAQSPQSGAALGGLSLAQLGDVRVVSVAKSPERLWTTPAAVYVLTQEDIRRSGATNLPDALRLVPGVQVARTDSDHWAVSVRGFNSQFSRDVLVLIDGRSVYTPLFAGVYWDVQFPPLDDIQRIEVIRGPGGSIWGANAVNGVIDVITMDATKTQGLSAHVRGGNVDQGQGELRYGGRLSAANFPRLAYRGYVEGFNRGPERHSDGDDFDRWHLFQTGFRADWSGARGTSASLEGAYYAGAAGVDVGIATIAPPQQLAVTGYQHVAGGDLVARWRRTRADGSSLSLEGYFDRTYRLGPQYGEGREDYSFDLNDEEKLGPAHFPNDLTWGVGFRASPSRFIQTVPTLDFVPENRADTIFSAFAQDALALTPRLTLTLGAKLLRDNYIGFEALPSARILWAQSPTMSWWAAVTRSVRTPSDLDEDLRITGLLTAAPPTFVEIIGNANFQAESLLGYEAGYRSLLGPSLYLDLAAFDNHYRNLEAYGAPTPERVVSPPPPHATLVYPYINGIKGESYGFEAAPDWQPRPWARLSAGYSLLRLSLHDQSAVPQAATIAAYEGSSPERQIFIAARLNLPRGVAFDPTLRRVGTLPAQSVPAYTTADLHLGWRPGRAWSFALVGRNLLQPYHFEFGGDPGPLVAIRRSYYAEARWTP